MILLEQVENGDSPLLLDIGVAAQDRTLVELDVDDAWFGHEPLLAGAAFFRQSLGQPPPNRHAELVSASMNMVCESQANPCSWIPDQVRDDVKARPIEPIHIIPTGLLA
jgi:hypothetical protein